MALHFITFTLFLVSNICLSITEQIKDDKTQEFRLLNEVTIAYEICQSIASLVLYWILFKFSGSAATPSRQKEAIVRESG